MSASLQQLLVQVHDHYHRLLVVVAPTRAGLTTTLAALGTELGVRVTPVSGRLAERLLELPPPQRGLRLQTLLEQVLSDSQPDLDAPVVLDNLEVLFERSLASDPLALLRRLSRVRTVVAGWSGTFDGSTLSYAEPGHQEHRRERATDVIVLPLAQLRSLLPTRPSPTTP